VIAESELTERAHSHHTPTRPNPLSYRHPPILERAAGSPVVVEPRRVTTCNTSPCGGITEPSRALPHPLELPLDRLNCGDRPTAPLWRRSRVRRMESTGSILRNGDLLPGRGRAVGPGGARPRQSGSAGPAGSKLNGDTGDAPIPAR
jgi:hypothetical protein